MNPGTGRDNIETTEMDDTCRIDERASDLARRVMNLPPNPKTKSKSQSTAASEHASKPGKSGRSDGAS